MEIIPIFLFCLATSITPGPNNIMLMSSGVNYGIAKSVPHLLGINAGFPIMVLAVGLGFGSLLLSFPIIYPVIKVLGISYLFVLAWNIATASAPDSLTKSKPLTFLQAVLFQWVNPKAWVASISAIATFTTADNFWPHLSLIVLGYLTLGGLSMLLWLSLGASLQKLLRNAKHLKYFNVSMALLLVLSVLPMIFAELNPEI